MTRSEPTFSLMAFAPLSAGLFAAVILPPPTLSVTVSVGPATVSAVTATEEEAREIVLPFRSSVRSYHTETSFVRVTS